MRILYHHRIASKDGQYVHVEEMIKAFRKKGHEVHIVGPKVVEEGDFGSDGGLVAILKTNIPGFIYELLEFSYNLIAFFRLYIEVKRFKPDFIYERYNLYLPSGIWVKKITNLPFILEVNAPILDERSKYDGISLKWLASWTERYCWRQADFILPVTQVLADRVMKDGITSDKITVIHNGIDPEKFSKVIDKESAKKKLGLDGKLVLGFTGFIRPWHGLDRVVELLHTYNDMDMHLLIVGEGPARNEIESAAKKLGVSDRITITGLVERADVAKYLAAFDIALQPDVVAYASPLKMFEYLALGHAIVAPDTKNIREILSHNVNAILFDVDNQNAFNDAIERLCKDEELRKKMGAAALVLIDDRQYRWLDNAEKVTALLAD